MYLQKDLTRGYNEYIDAQQDDLGTQMDVGVLVLEGGDRFVIQEPEKECAVSLLCGDVTITWAWESAAFSDQSGALPAQPDQSLQQEVYRHAETAGSTRHDRQVETARCTRRDIFREEASCLLAPAGTRIELTAASHAELYLQKTRNERVYEPVLYRPEDVQIQHAGGKGELQGCMERQIKTFFDYDNAPFSNMVLGEVLNYPGKWSSYPPHHHPQPEVYFYRFDRAQGFGAGFADGEVYQVKHNGLTIIHHGFHSQAAAPGYAMCYLWGIRHLDGDPWRKTRIDDPEHAWLLAEDAEDHIWQG